MKGQSWVFLNFLETVQYFWDRGSILSLLLQGGKVLPLSHLSCLSATFSFSFLYINVYLRNIISITNKLMTDNQLNISCIVAAAKARLKFCLSPTIPIETIVLVQEVPMLAPITIGIPILTDMTKI